MHHLFLAVVLVLAVAPLGAVVLPSADDRKGEVAPSRVVARHPQIQASLGRLWERSPSWRSGLRQVAGAARVVVVTPDQVMVQEGTRRRSFDADLLGEVIPMIEPGGRVTRVLVVINVPLIEATYARRLSTLAEIHADLDRVLAHEVFGHALPYLQAGDTSGHCADPQEGERPEDSCAISRENIIRAELGLGRRTDAGLSGLALARRSRF